MKWLIDILEEFWQEKGTSFLRRAFLALMCGSGIAFVITIAKNHEFQMTMNQRVYTSIVVGVMAMAVTGMLELSGLCWSRGCLGKLLACFIIFVSVAGLIALIALAHARFQTH